MDYILKAENLTKIYGHHKALDNFSIHIPQGSTYGLVGKNGAGKTTLLRIICGLQEATSGDYSLYGISSRKHEILNARKEMGAVIETPAIYLDEAMVTGTVAFKVSLLAQSLSPGLLTIMLLYSII